MKPTLTLDLSGPDGNTFMVIGYARELLTGLMQEHYNEEVRAVLASGSGKTRADILAIVNRYVTLVDSSGLYPEYAPKAAE